MRNPFITDRPLTEQDPFYGREALFQRLQDALLEGAQCFFLFGKRRIGKTSFLNQLPLRLGSRYDVYHILWGETPSPFQDKAPFQALLSEMALALSQKAPSDLAEDFASLAQALRGIQKGVPEGHVALFCFDALPIRTFEETTWAHACEALAQALPQAPSVALLIAIEGNPEEMTRPLEALPGHTMVLGPFSLDDTSDLLMFLTHGTIHFDPESVRRIHVLSGGEPLFVQHFGRLLFEARERHGWVSLPDVDRAAERLVEEASAEFETLWQAASPLERVVLCVFAERVGNQGLGTAEDVMLHLTRAHVRLSSEAINEMLDRLKKRGILEELGGRVFRIRNGLFFHWIKRTQSLATTVRRAPGVHTIRQKPISPWRPKRIDWVSVILSIVALLLVGAIAFVWRSREVHTLWTATPTPEEAPASDAPSPAPSITPEKGVLGGSIVYIAKATPQEKWAIYRMRADGSDPIRLTFNDANDTAPAVSPDGRRIAFVSDRDGNREVYVMNADGSDQQNLTRDGAEDWTPAWSPDGKQIAFASYRDGNWELYVMNANGSNPKRLTRHSAADYSPAWSPDGTRLAFVSDRDSNLEIYILELATGAVTRFTKDPATDQAPTWSPDGEITWESYREGNMEIYSAAPDGSNLRNLSQDAYANDHGAAWAPWGRYLVWYSNRDKGWDIYRLDTQTGERVNLTMSAALEQWPHWGP